MHYTELQIRTGKKAELQIPLSGGIVSGFRSRKTQIFNLLIFRGCSK